VKVFDTLAAEYRGMLATVEVFDALVVFLTHVRGEVALVRRIVTLVLGRVHVKALFEVDP